MLLDEKTMSASSSSIVSAPEVSSDLSVSDDSRYAISTASQAIAVADQLRHDWEVGILAQATITAQLNGQRPRRDEDLEDLGKGWMPNMSVGWLRNECSRLPARFFMPILTAQYLTAAELPSGWPRAAQKQIYFWDEVSKAIRRWDCWDWFVSLLAREVSFFGFGFAAFLEEYEWRPVFIRQDRGFVPVGTSVTDADGPPAFLADYDYQPWELLKLAQQAKDKGYVGWKYDAVAAAISSAQTKTNGAAQTEVRKFEELTREFSAGYCVEKGFRVIECQILFSRDADGTVTKQILTRNPNKVDGREDEGADSRLLFERREYAKNMSDVVIPAVFDPDTGTIHGSWGAAQMLFDMSLEAENSFNDMRASTKQAAMAHVQASASNTLDQVYISRSDYAMTIAGGTFAGNLAASSVDPTPYIKELEALTTAAREKIGNYIPPISLSPNDLKAAQINAKDREQQERREQALHMWLKQFARIVRTLIRRMVDPKSPDEESKKLVKRLLKQLTKEEIRLLADQPPIRTIYDFTEYAMNKRAMFAAEMRDDPYFNKKALRRTMSVAAGGPAWTESVMIPGDDITIEQEARRMQIGENGDMLNGFQIQVLPQDEHWFHMVECRPFIESLIMQRGDFKTAAIALAHYASHHIGAVNTQGMPKDAINPSTSFMARVAKSIREQMPPQEGFADKLSPVEAVNAQLGGAPLVSQPSDSPELSSSGVPEAGLDALVAGQAG
jgi:hypothetical protein